MAVPAHPKRPRDTNQLAKLTVDMASGEGEVMGSPWLEPYKDPAAVALGRKGGMKGGLARAQKLSATERADIARMAARSRWAKSRKQGESMLPLNWSKHLSRSDAQEETEGAPMPFLRFTKTGAPSKDDKWFRETFFDCLAWEKGVSSQGRDKETAQIKIHVRMPENNLGIKTMDIDYIPARTINHSAPTVHLNYDPETRQALEAKILTGRLVTVARDEHGNFSMTIE